MDVQTMKEAVAYYEGMLFEEDGWSWIMEEQFQLEIKYKKLLEEIIQNLMNMQVSEECLFYLYSWARLGYYQNSQLYVKWIKEHFGDEESTKFMTFTMKVQMLHVTIAEVQ